MSLLPNNILKALSRATPKQKVYRSAVARELRIKLSSIQDHLPLEGKCTVETRALENLIRIVENHDISRWAIEAQRVLGVSFQVIEEKKIDPVEAICPNCKGIYYVDDGLHEHQGVLQCDGCLESVVREESDDPHGKGWAP